LQPPDTLPGL